MSLIPQYGEIKIQLNTDANEGNLRRTSDQVDAFIEVLKSQVENLGLAKVEVEWI